MASDSIIDGGEGGFFKHVCFGYTETALKSGWCKSYAYELTLTMSQCHIDLTWQIPLFYERVIRLLYNAKRFNLRSVLFRMEECPFHLMPGCNTTDSAKLPHLYRNIGPHILVTGILKVSDFISLQRSLKKNEEWRGGGNTRFLHSTHISHSKPFLQYGQVCFLFNFFQRQLFFFLKLC